MSRKHDPEFIELLLKHTTLDEKQGLLTFKNVYAQICINISWRNKMIVVPYSHVVWLLKHGMWPAENMVLDHINNVPTDNRPENLQEITQNKNQEKRRGRLVYRSYGTGKYGYGINVHYDKRDGRYYVVRHLSRGHGKGDLKGIRRGLGGFDTLEDAERQVAGVIEDIKQRGLDFLPQVEKNQPKATIELDKRSAELRQLRISGKTIGEIKEITGLKSIYRMVKDIKVQSNQGARNPSAKLNEEKVREIRALHAVGRKRAYLAIRFGVTSQLINSIIKGRLWAHVV